MKVWADAEHAIECDVVERISGPRVADGGAIVTKGPRKITLFRRPDIEHEETSARQIPRKVNVYVTQYGPRPGLRCQDEGIDETGDGAPETWTIRVRGNADCDVSLRERGGGEEV